MSSHSSVHRSSFAVAVCRFNQHANQRDRYVYEYLRHVISNLLLNHGLWASATREIRFAVLFLHRKKPHTELHDSDE